MSNLGLPMSAETLVPHRRPMCLIDRLVHFESKAGIVETVVTSDGIVADADGIVDSTVLLELMAQSYAAMKGYEDLLQGKAPQKGFLVSVKHFEVLADARVGDLLEIAVSTAADVGGFTVADGTITRGHVQIATGSLTLWIP